MELKKNREADLERKRGVFFQIGLVTALAVVLIAFEWTAYENTENTLGELTVQVEEEEMIPITQRELQAPPPPPPQVTTIEIVQDEEEVEDIVMQETEATEETKIEVIQQVEEEVEEPEIFLIVEDMPAFPGCERITNKQERDICSQTEILKYLGNNVKYPAMAKDAGISGTVYVSFIVDQHGKVKNAEILRGIGGGCDEEALRVVNNMPSWTPGKQRGKPVKVQYRLPIKYTLKN